jgi:dTDP-glucose pyrophosphorylase
MITNWSKICISPTQKILEALKLIDLNSHRIVLVVEDKKLLGVVTDGDIRRGLINQLDLNCEVSKVMNSYPVTADSSWSRYDLVKLMKSKQVLAIPILENDEIVGLETLEQINTTKKHENLVFIMAGGFGTRLKPLTDSCPKPLLKVGDKPILEIVIENFIKTGFVNFCISTHYRAEMIREYFGDGTKLGINIEYVYEDMPLGTGGALGLLPDNTSDLPVIVINGDILTKVDFDQLLRFHEENKCVATMCVRDYQHQVPFGVINGEGNKVKNMVEKPLHRFFVNAGVYVINSEIHKTVRKNSRVDMPSLLSLFLEKNASILMYPIHEYWLDIGSHEDFQKAQVDILTLDLQ